MVIQAFCNECKGEPCCNRTLELHSIQDEYSHLTNVLVRVNCELFIYNTRCNTAYGTLNPDIRFEKNKFTQCDFCLYKSVCKYDPEVVAKGANEVLDRLKEKLDVKIACTNFHPNQQQIEETEAYGIDDAINTFCELLDLEHYRFPDTFNTTGKDFIDFFYTKGLHISFASGLKDEIKKVHGSPSSAKVKKGFFKGRKR